MALTPEGPTGDGESSRPDDEKILTEAHERLRIAEDAEAENRRLGLEDLEFRAGKQWPDAIETERARDGRPCLVINRIPQFIQQVANDQRQNRPSIKVHPVDDNGDIETAKVIQGIVRHIEADSNADVAYDTAFDSAVTSGFGYLRVITDYVDPLSFEQKILIKRVRNPYSVFFDPYSSEPDGSDANWAFVVDEMSKEDYKQQFGETKLAKMGDWNAIGNNSPNWLKGDSCRIAEYFYRSWTQKTIVQLADGTSLLKDQHAQVVQQLQAQGMDASSANPVKERVASVPIISWCKLNGVEIMEKTEWLGRWVPIIPVFGTELYINGKRVLEGIIRNSKDSQRMYNYWSSAETEAIALAPRAPFIMAEGQDEGHEDEWATANRRNHSRLVYRPTALNGNPVAPPQRNAFEPAVQAISNARMMASEDLKATTGIYDAALGNRSNETSGIAIRNRANQAQTSNFHFIDNLTRSLRHTGRILVDLIPHIYDTARAVRIIGEEGDQRIVKINQPTKDQGEQVLYAMDTGTYDVTVDVGPSFASKRMEAVASMLDLTKSVPQIAQVAGDLMIKSMDWPGAQEIADRIRKTLPPGLADDQKDQKPLPPEVQAKMQQMGQMLDQLTQTVHSQADLIETKTIELESRERIEFAKMNLNAEIEMAKIGSTEAITMLKSQVSEIQHRLDLVHMQEPIPDSSQGQLPTQPPQAQPTGGPPPGSPTGM